MAADSAHSQDYPNKPIRMITAEVGGDSDRVLRILGPVLSGYLKQNVIIENRPSGAISGELVSRAPPDGYALLTTGSPFWIGPLLGRASYDPVADFAPITMLARAPAVLVVHPSLPVRTVKELIVLAKAKPGELDYSSGGTGGTAHLAAELFRSMAGISMTRIPFKGIGPAITSLIGGHVQLAFGTAGSVASHLKSGRLRALAVTSANPSALLPGLPAIAGAGLPGYEAVVLTGTFAPAKTPGALLNRLSQELMRVLNQTDIREKFMNTGVEAVGSSPDEFAATIRSEMARLGKVIKDAGIKID